MPDEPPHFGSVEPPKKPELPATVTSEEELGEKKATMTPEEELGGKKATMTPEEELGGKKATMTPEEELSEEKIKLEEITKAIEKKNVEKSASDKKIADLDKKINDVTKVVEAYKKEYENIIKVKNGLDEYCTEWYPIIGNRIPDNRKAFINDTIKNFKIETDNLRHSIEEEDGELRKNYKLAKKDFDDAQKALNDKQFEYDKLKKRQNEIEEVIKDIQNLKSMIDKSDEAIDAEKRYFWISEIKMILDVEKPDALPKKIITTDELKATLYDKSDVLKTINNTFTEKDKALKVARNECENKRKILESRDKNRRNEILQIINDP